MLVSGLGHMISNYGEVFRDFPPFYTLPVQYGMSLCASFIRERIRTQQTFPFIDLMVFVYAGRCPMEVA